MNVSVVSNLVLGVWDTLSYSLGTYTIGRFSSKVLFPLVVYKGPLVPWVLGCVTIRDELLIETVKSQHELPLLHDFSDHRILSQDLSKPLVPRSCKTPTILGPVTHSSPLDLRETSFTEIFPSQSWQVRGLSSFHSETWPVTEVAVLSLASATFPGRRLTPHPECGLIFQFSP